MKTCPICASSIEKENQEYCLTCAWEFEYFFDELSEDEKKKYSHRSKLYGSIYNISQEPKYRKSLETQSPLLQQLRDFESEEENKQVIEEKVTTSLEDIAANDLIVIDRVMYQKLSFYNYDEMNWDAAEENNNMNYEEYKLKFSYNYEDWRLPTVEELLKLINSKKSFSKKTNFLWTSEETDANHAWAIKLEDGEKYSVLKSSKNFVVYVRDIKEEES